MTRAAAGAERARALPLPCGLTLAVCVYLWDVTNPGPFRLLIGDGSIAPVRKCVDAPLCLVGNSRWEKGGTMPATPDSGGTMGGAEEMRVYSSLAVSGGAQSRQTYRLPTFLSEVEALPVG